MTPLSAQRRGQEVVECVVERTDVGLHLLTQVPRKVAQALPRLDGGPHQHDAADPALLEHGDGLAHRQVRLARPGRPHGEEDVVRPDGPDVGPLPRGLGTDGLAPRRRADDLAVERLQLRLAPLRQGVHRVPHVGGPNLVPALRHRRQLAQEAGDDADGRLVRPRRPNGPLPDGEGHGISGLHRLQVLIVRPDEPRQRALAGQRHRLRVWGRGAPLPQLVHDVFYTG